MSANTGLVTHGGATHEVNQYYNSVIVQLPGTGHTQTTKYCFLSRVDPWPDEQNPPAVELTQQNIKNVYKNMFIIKRVYPQDMRPMVDRIDWTAGTTYYCYRDDIDIIARDSNGRMLYPHFVKNRFDQVFKCLWNGANSDNPNGVPSTSEPYFQPGYMSNNLVFTGADGYKWIYLYSIDASLKQKFLTEDFMPTPLANTAGYGSNTVNSGNVPVVGVFNGGSGYYSTNTQVYITGANSTQALAHAIVDPVSTSITDIVIDNFGANYITANVVIIGAGSGAVAYANVSPPNGHGSDPFEEFGTNHIMVTQTFTQNELGSLPTDIDYRQIGFVINPVAHSSYPYQCENPTYSCTTDAVVAVSANDYQSDEIVYQGTDVANATFFATCLSYEPGSGLVRMINTEGTMTVGKVLKGVSSGVNKQVLSANLPDFIPFSGYITYIENRTGTQRSSDGSEQVRLIVGF
jgi:hypothetical protein